MAEDISVDHKFEPQPFPEAHVSAAVLKYRFYYYSGLTKPALRACACSITSVGLCNSVVAGQFALLMGFSRQESWSGLPCPPPGDLPIPGVTPTSLMSPAGGRHTTSTTWKALEARRSGDNYL